MAKSLQDIRNEELGAVQALIEFQEKTLPLVKKYAGNMLYIRQIGNKISGFVGPDDMNYLKSVYRMYGKKEPEADDYLIHMRIRER